MVIVRQAGPNLGLPFLTGSCAHGAKTVGGFGLVTVRLTIPYHRRDLGQTLPSGTFTNHYHRDQRTHNRTQHGLTFGFRVRWHGSMVMVITVDNRKNHKGWWHGGGRYRKDFSFSERSAKTTGT